MLCYHHHHTDQDRHEEIIVNLVKDHSPTAMVDNMQKGALNKRKEIINPL
jgi:hypothetical protein